MGKYISAAACADIISEKFNIPLDDLIDVFADIPAANVDEVKYGEWIVVGRTEHGKSILKCSHCGRVRKNHGKSSFCCDCGAKMDGGNAE